MWLEEFNDTSLLVNLDVAANCEVSRLLIDTESSVYIIFLKTLDQMEIDKLKIRKTKSTLTRFTKDASTSYGMIELLVLASRVIKLVDFTVVDQSAPYNAIHGTTWLYVMRAIPSTYQ